MNQTMHITVHDMTMLGRKALNVEPGPVQSRFSENFTLLIRPSSDLENC